MTESTRDAVNEAVEEYRAQIADLARTQASLVEGDMGPAGLDRLDLGPDPLPSIVTDALASQAGCYARWGFLYKEAQEEHAELLDEYELWWAGVYETAREGLPASTTEGKVKAKILADEANAKAYTEKRGKIREAEKRAEQCKYAMKAWEQRATLITTLGGLLREEIQASRTEHVNEQPRRRVRPVDRSKADAEERPRKKKRRKPAGGGDAAAPERAREARHPSVPKASSERKRKPVNVVVDNKPPSADDPDDDERPAARRPAKKKAKRRELGGMMRKGKNGEIPL